MVSKEELMQKFENHAKDEKIKLNHDSKRVDLVINSLIKIKDKKGDIYCPCRITTGDKNKDKDIVCPCIYHLDEIKNDGHCKCYLFEKRK